MKLLTPRNYYKPFEYPWAFTLWKHHEAMHWMGLEVPLHEDVKDWNEKLTEGEKSLLTSLFRFFTQADTDVANGYVTRYLPYFSHKPELVMMMSSFAAREAVHMDAYALLIETIGMEEDTYKQFREYKEMCDKHEYAMKFNMESPIEALKTLAVYSAFTEGVQLFASFAVLLNFPRHNKMKNMSNIISWSIRDEDLHVEGMTMLFKELYNEFDWSSLGDENKEKNKFLREIKKIAMDIVTLEDHFIDLIYKDIDTLENLTSDQVKAYIRFITNKRWKQLGFDGVVYEAFTVNPLPWIEEMVNGEEHTNFFESKSTAYSKAMTKGSFEDIEWE